MSEDTMRALQDGLIQAGLGHLIIKHDEPQYVERISNYWSKNQHLRPWFILQPATTNEVSKVLTNILRFPDVTFAVRSGGHTVWAGASNIADGVTIDLGKLNKTIYDPVTKIASIGPGARWTHVYEELDKHGVVVAGGRDGDVGVGGFTLGGGISWFLPRIGFSCDQVINFEVVLADGQVVQANQKDHPDLYQVLKGASGNFGIVTRLDFATFVEPVLWRGIRIMDKSTTNVQIEALVDFTTNLYRQPDNYCGLLWTYQTSFKDIVCLHFMSNSKGDDNPPAFKKWLGLPALVDTTTKASVAVHAKNTEEPSGYYTTWTNLLIKNDPATVSKIVELHSGVVEELKGKSPSGDFWTMALFQPMPHFIAGKGFERGGNVMGLDQVEEDALLFIAGVHVKEEEMSEVGNAVCQEWHRQIEEFARKEKSHLDWLYLNYADKDQDPFKTVGKENAEKIGKAAVKYDPGGVFQTRCPGGFKISKSEARPALS